MVSVRFSMLFVLVSVSAHGSPSMCLKDIKSGLESCVVIFWVRAVHLVNRMVSLYSVRYVYL